MANSLNVQIMAPPDHLLGQYQAWKIAGDFEAPVDLAWISAAHSETPAAHRVLPHGEPSLALLRRRDRQGDISELKLVVCGPYHKAKHYRPKASEELIAVRLKPEISAALFEISPSDYSETAIADAPAALSSAFLQTLRLGEFANAAYIISILIEGVKRVANSRPAKHGPERKAAAQLRATQGRVRLRELAIEIGVSERHLRRRFTDHVGCSPKAYARYQQITAAALSAEKVIAPEWAEIATSTGFHDQAHMINAFRAKTGLTPKAFHAERRKLLAPSFLSVFCNTGSPQ